MNRYAAKILGAQKRLEELSNIFDVRKMAARIEEAGYQRRLLYFVRMDG